MQLLQINLLRCKYGIERLNNIPDGWMGLDIGEKSVIAIFVEVIKNSKTILWNGPMGVFEMSCF